MVQETEYAQGLWVHQESVIIGADSHDIWSLTPEFLLSNGIVPEDWSCTQANRTADSVSITLGPVRWQMTERTLWITLFADCPIDDEARIEGGHIIPDLARRYMETVPYTPTRQLWLNWEVSVIKRNHNAWMRDNFEYKEWPTDLGTAMLEPKLTFVIDDVLYQVEIKNEESQRQDKTYEDSIQFECFVCNQQERSVSSIILGFDHWEERLSTFEKAINHLLKGGGT